MDARLSSLEPLLDTSFRHFVTLRLVRILYVVAVAILAIFLTFSILTGLIQARSFFRGLATG